MPCVPTHEKLMMKINIGKREGNEEYSEVVIRTVT
jgi:hypothetical protein